jgi:hypothetical protein
MEGAEVVTGRVVSGAANSDMIVKQPLHRHGEAWADQWVDPSAHCQLQFFFIFQTDSKLQWFKLHLPEI